MKNLKLTFYKEGFTLIELLVAIAIIGILSSFLLANFVGVRQRARDGVRKSDLRQIQSALELYKSENLNGNYPAALTLTCNCALTSSGVDCNNPPAGTVYMKKIPCDPTSTTSTPAYYTYSPSGSGYSLIACLENSNDSQADGAPTPVECSAGSKTYKYTLQNP